MTTVTGNILDASGNPVGVVVQFVSTSTPTVNAPGTVIGNSTLQVRSNPSTGFFSQALEAGNYNVTYFTNPLQTVFTIAVDGITPSVTINQVTTTPLAYQFVAPNTLWNQIFPSITLAQLNAISSPTEGQMVYIDDIPGNTHQPQYWNGSAWVPLGGSVTGVLVAGAINLSNQTNSIVTSTIATASGSGLYELSGVALVTTSGSGGALTVAVNWIDEVGIASSIAVLNMPMNVTGRQEIDPLTFSAVATTAIQYSTTVTNGTGNPAYTIKMAVKKLI